MKETLRLSDAPMFREILIAFALRLHPDLTLERLVLADVSTDLTYKDGRTFPYTLDPANFRVEDLDEPEREISPINGSSQARQLVYSIRDTSGSWHRPIGTTCIFKDILKIEERRISETEDDLLTSLHQARQQELLRSSGEDLRAYGRRNDLHEGMMTPIYLRSLSHDDPIREHLRRLLEERLPFTRAGIKVLRTHARQTSESVVRRASEQAQAELRPATAPPPTAQPEPVRRRAVFNPDIRMLSQSVLSELRPHHGFIAEQLAAALHSELATVFDSNLDSVPISLACHTALRDLTGESLTLHEWYSRGSSAALTEQIKDLQQRWSEIEPFLTDCTSLGRQLLRDRLMASRLTVYEWSVLRDAARDAQPSLIPERALCGAEEQETWAALTEPLQLHLMLGDEDLLDRLERRRLLLGDLPRLQQYRAVIAQAQVPEQVCRHLQQEVWVARVHLERQADFEIAVRYNTFPPALQAELERIADEAGLDAGTWHPLQLPDGCRTLLLNHWFHFDLILRTDPLYAALEADQYTLEQQRLLTALAEQPLTATAVTDKDRQRLLEAVADWRSGCRPAVFVACLEALTTRSYPLGVIDELPGLLACVDRAEQKRERRRLEGLERAAQHLYDRLLSRWSSMNSGRVSRLKQATSHAFLEQFPEECRRFQVEDRISLELEESIWRWLSGAVVLT